MQENKREVTKVVCLTKTGNTISRYIHLQMYTFANRVDSDVTARNKTSHQDLHCLPF